MKKIFLKKVSIIITILIMLTLSPFVKFNHVGATTSSIGVEEELKGIINQYGEENIIFEDGIVLDLGQEVSTSNISANEGVISWRSNNSDITSVSESTIKAISEGTTFLIGEESGKYHLREIYIRGNEEEMIRSSGSTFKAGNSQYHVFIDPGHGGSDPGAVAYGKNEKDIVLTIALKVKSRLEAQGIKVTMTRTNDTFVSLRDRSRQANAAMPDAFVSIHANASGLGTAYGIETFYNKNIDLSLATGIQNSMISKTGANNRGVKFGDFHVIRETNMPAALAEVGFIDNGAEHNLIINDAYQNKLSDAISSATVQYLKANVSLNALTATRISGSDRYATSRNIFNNGWKTAETVVLADGTDYPDALAAAPLAGKYNAPIVLTERRALSSQPELVNMLKSKGVKSAYIIGGFNTLPGMIDNELSAMGITPKRIGGATRYETSVKVAQELGKVTETVIAYGYGFADSLSMSSIAAMKGMPIILTDPNSLSVEAKNYIKNSGSTKNYIIGSTTAVSTAVQNSIPNTERIGGADRYETNKAIFNKFKGELGLKDLFIASAVDFPDALSGSALATQRQAFMVLSNAKSVEPAPKSLISENRGTINTVTILGGQSAVTNNVIYGLGIDKIN